MLDGCDFPSFVAAATQPRAFLFLATVDEAGRSGPPLLRMYTEKRVISVGPLYGRGRDGAIGSSDAANKELPGKEHRTREEVLKVLDMAAKLATVGHRTSQRA